MSTDKERNGRMVPLHGGRVRQRVSFVGLITLSWDFDGDLERTGISIGSERVEPPSKKKSGTMTSDWLDSPMAWVD